MEPEHEALESQYERALARRKSANGIYQKIKREGGPPGEIARLRNDYFEKARIVFRLEEAWFPVRDRLDCR